MSSPKSRLILSPEARKDLTSILRYTGEQWGLDQLQVYRAKLTDALQLIEQNPRLGHTSPDLPDTHRLFFVGAHVIIYRLRDDTTQIVRILHQRMSIPRHL
jgi:toxin ParE1/3/4